MQKAGYIKKSGYHADDQEGSAHQILEIRISGRLFGVKIHDARRAIYTGLSCPVWKLKHSRGQHITWIEGSMTLSNSKKAVNIRLNNGGLYTASAASLKSIISGYTGYLIVSKIRQPAKNPVQHQSLITPWITA
ncbi:hypothetical protein F1737_10240 [Methanoplanus sp. FWC-SCC4]|uniref:Uncharacterized protein n=1 Tax=Methanochimaera problematica TaxID=2609417 RepID=A0AA97FF39_9EURY|nr:hypothetical protein [Methanoplanus sp. FWC-SCC4]WOF17029.1 hypothetical protein F1737_10240 [Methanoplanus sp. FWC-SCC4]